MTFNEWFFSELHRAKYTNDHPAYLAAQEAWDAAHEACAKVCEQTDEDGEGTDCWGWHSKDYAAAIRARGQA